MHSNQVEPEGSAAAAAATTSSASSPQTTVQIISQHKPVGATSSRSDYRHSIIGGKSTRCFFSHSYNQHKFFGKRCEMEILLTFALQGKFSYLALSLVF
jgi:hypothetical protein